ncbi:MAG TPA: stage V sporulation protein AD [Ruminococcaceae bacterium]|nr:stage V sporulation protein AD [Oscillospiraceae bacterium]
MAERIGNSTIFLNNRPSITGYGSVVGKTEREGPLGDEFDRFDIDIRFGEKTFERAESRIQKIAVETALKKAGISEKDCDVIFAGDLLNQCIGSTFGLKDKNIPYVGIYGACSTMALGLSLASVFVDCGIAKNAVAVTSSHFCSAERQYRFPLEYGALRTPTSQRTVTGSGAAVLSLQGDKPYINSVTFGKIVDRGVCDANNMGAAMAPSAADTIKEYFYDTNTSPEDYDIIITGDLGFVGTKLLYELLLKDDIDIRCKHNDCGQMIYDKNLRDVNAGGSGCGCSAVVLNSYIMHRFENRDFNNILFMSTGALLSPTSALQGESIPGITHLLNIRNPE